MKYRLMDLLACPMCRAFPLKLLVIEEETHENRRLDAKPPLCELYCGYKKSHMKDIREPPPCDECIKKEIRTAVIYCEKCSRWYPVIDYIPHMLPDYIREEEEERREELEFLRKYADKIPDYIKFKALPHNLSSQQD